MSKIDKTHSLSVSRQCDLLDVPRSSFYYSPREDGSYNEGLMKQIDNQYMITPFYGVPRMTHHFRGIGYEVNPKRVRRLYRKMDLYATGPRPNTSKPCDLFLPAAWIKGDTPQSGLGDGYHLYPVSWQSSVPGCHH
ncbi:MAG: IS3 family transposase [Tissierellia bacterium]|nr:IS3 family transposase [Tissierellia bacterium]